MTQKIIDIYHNNVLFATICFLLLISVLLSNSAFAQDDSSAPPPDWGFGSAPANSQPPPDWGFGSQPSNNDWGSQPSTGGWGSQPGQSGWGSQPSRGGVRIRITNPLAGIADSIPQLVGYVLGIVKGLAYFVALAMIIYGAYQIMIGEQGGNKSKYLAGWKTIQYAVIGFALILLSSVIADVVREIVAGV